MCSKVDLWVKTNQLRILEQFMKKSFLRLNGNFAFDRNHLKQHCCYCYCSSNECICLFIYFHIFIRYDRSRFLVNTSERFPAAFKCLSTYLSLSLSLTHTHTHTLHGTLQKEVPKSSVKVYCTMGSLPIGSKS